MRDYARREWNGLMKDYYYARWYKWAAEFVPEAVQNKEAVDIEDFVKQKRVYRTIPTSNEVEVSRRLFSKYKMQFKK